MHGIGVLLSVAVTRLSLRCGGKIARWASGSTAPAHWRSGRCRRCATFHCCCGRRCSTTSAWLQFQCDEFLPRSGIACEFAEEAVVDETPRPRQDLCLPRSAGGPAQLRGTRRSHGGSGRQPQGLCVFAAGGAGERRRTGAAGDARTRFHRARLADGGYRAGTRHTHR